LALKGNVAAGREALLISLMKSLLPVALANLSHGSSGAVFDSRRRYRYLLWRNWDESLPAASFVMLNPSAADEHTNDPTIARSVALASSQGFGRIFVVNLFAYMTKSPVLLKKARYPITCRTDARDGGHNDDYIKWALVNSGHIVLAWGNHGAYLNRHLEVLKLVQSLEVEDKCLMFSLTKQGQPRHPLYTPNCIKLQRLPEIFWN